MTPSGQPDLSSPVIRSVIAATVAINLLVLAVPLYINRIYTSVLPQKAGDSLLVITGLLIATLAIDILLKLGRAWILSWMAASQEHRLRMRGIRSFLSSQLKDAEAVRLDDRLEQLRSAAQLRSNFEQQWLVRHVDLPFAIVYLVVLGLIGGWLILIPLALVPFFLWQGSRAAKQLDRALERKQEQDSFRNTVTVASLQSASTVKALNLEGFLIRRMEPAEETFGEALWRQECATARLQNLSQLFSQWSQLLIVSFGGWMVMNQNLSSGALAACTLLSAQVTMPISKLFTANAQRASVRLAEKQANALAHLPAEENLLSGDPVPLSGILQLRNIAIPAGGIALISGGRTNQSIDWLETVTGLRSAIPEDFTLDSQSLAKMEKLSLRQQIRLIRYGEPLLRGTLLENLTLFRSDRHADRAVDLCKTHGVFQQICTLPKGFDSLVGERQDYPIPIGLAFRIQVIQALVEDPRALLIDAISHEAPMDQLQWVFGLEIAATRIIAVKQPVNQLSTTSTLQLTWEGDELVEVQR